MGRVPRFVPSDDAMIALASIALAAWEATALLTKRPTITKLSARPGTRPLVFGWFLCLGIHFVQENRKH